MPRRPSTHIDDPAAVGARIRAARAEVGLKQRELTFEGCTPAYLSRIEAGQRIPSLQILTRLAERLGTTAEFLATGKHPDPDPLFEAELAARTGDTELARRLYGRAATSGTPALSARAEAALGRLAFDEGDREGAVELLERALAKHDLPSPERATALELLGKTLALLARFDESGAAFDQGLAAAQAAHDKPVELRFSVLLANLLIDRGNPERAEELLSSIIDDARKARDPVALANLYWSQARLHASQRQQDLAARYARMAHATVEATEHTVVAARALTLLAHIENDRGNHADALAFADEGTPVLATAGNRLDEGMLLLEKARALGALDRREDAIGIALGAIPRFEHAHPTSAARGYAVAAEIFKDLGENAHALELYELAVETSPTEDRHLADMYRAIAEIHESEDRPAEALSYFKRALDIQAHVHHA
ncbi:MAG TPA: helix-turn-helix domain-containing protein [Gaiellaceae bacterium]|nr:helix-turn-helix domain-containing protein [Gaiellaceae bacterium]